MSHVRRNRTSAQVSNLASLGPRPVELVRRRRRLERRVVAQLGASKFRSRERQRGRGRRRGVRTAASAICRRCVGPRRPRARLTARSEQVDSAPRPPRANIRAAAAAAQRDAPPRHRRAVPAARTRHLRIAPRRPQSGWWSSATRKPAARQRRPRASHARTTAEPPTSAVRTEPGLERVEKFMQLLPGDRPEAVSK